MNLIAIRKVIRKILNEEIGRDQKSIRTDPYSMIEDNPYCYVDIYPSFEDQMYYLNLGPKKDYVKLISPNYIINDASFASEEDAKNYANQILNKIFTQIENNK